MKRAGGLTIEVFCLVVIILGVAGCLAVPIPVSDTSRDKYEQIQFVKGVTTRTEVLHTLSQPKFEMTDPHIIGYELEVAVGYMPWVIIPPPAPGSPAQPGLSTFPPRAGIAALSYPEYFFVAFDKNDHVSAWGIYGYKEGGRQAVQDYARAWARQEGLVVPELAASVVSAVPQGQGLVYIYRPGGFFRSFIDDPYTAPAVSVDGKLEAELERGTYIAVPLTVGKHIVSVDPKPHYNALTPEENRPIRSIPLEVAPNMKYFVSFRVSYGWGKLDPVLTIQSEQEAMPILENMTRAK